MLKASQINLTNVTGEMIGHCSKWTEGGKSFWLVENEAMKLDPETFEVIEYKVTHDEKGFHCTCWAGLDGWAHCKNGYCKHLAWALAAEKELREAMNLIAQELEVEKALLLVAQEEKEEEEKKAAKEKAAKDLAAKYPRAAKGDLQSKAFSLLR